MDHNICLWLFNELICETLLKSSFIVILIVWEINQSLAVIKQPQACVLSHT